MDTIKIKLIKAKDKDKKFLFDLRIKTMVEHLENAGIYLSNDEHRSRVDKGFDASYIIMQSDQRVGLLKCFENEKAFEIAQLQILPEFQGKGIGREVISQLIIKAEAVKKTLTLKVLKKNPARHLYERIGFTIIAQDRYEYDMIWNKT
ncbi:N-acetyltransferase [Aquimarina sp. AU474]|uniref:GNAT family N-acetyltransferase n=1 Tax=Aquimarina sp. AU474 TaxID=2108529 RepID=UPI001358A7F2|nr:GNAT family N-acetyltransferase [Aquimarina sp. AU474]